MTKELFPISIEGWQVERGQIYQSYEGLFIILYADGWAKREISLIEIQPSEIIILGKADMCDKVKMSIGEDNFYFTLDDSVNLFGNFNGNLLTFYGPAQLVIKGTENFVFDFYDVYLSFLNRLGNLKFRDKEIQIKYGLVSTEMIKAKVPAIGISFFTDVEYPKELYGGKVCEFETDKEVCIRNPVPVRISVLCELFAYTQEESAFMLTQLLTKFRNLDTILIGMREADIMLEGIRTAPEEFCPFKMEVSFKIETVFNEFVFIPKVLTKEVFLERKELEQ
jgi:hypothetical protein